jgi:2-polyprenyl-6-methoxyphenol hydroxylase-like FAD-dependent oxidoreductase
MDATSITTKCCIAGGGPSGLMLGFLLARAGVDIVVLEKHGDFLRDFRGDTIHPSTLELIGELRLIDEFLKQPHRKVDRLTGLVGDTQIRVADFTGLRTTYKFIVLMPQWDFLNFLSRHGQRYAGFRLMMKTEATGLLEHGGRVIGLRAISESGPVEVRADLVVAADGRQSTLRERAGLRVIDLGAPMDVLWTRISRRPDDRADAFGHIEAGRILVMLDRGEYWQCAFVIPKGSAAELRKKPIDDFCHMILDLSPWLGERVNEIKSWDDVKLLTVAVDRLSQWWRPGLLCIGDAAHAMSPIGGVGINLAVQDAVAAANILAEPLRAGSLSSDYLARVQARREWPTRVTQQIQLIIQNRIIRRVLTGSQRPEAPRVAKLLNWIPILQRIPARVIGIGVRPEHIQTGEAHGALR